MCTEQRGARRGAETVAWFAFGGERDDWAADATLQGALWLRLYGELWRLPGSRADAVAPGRRLAASRGVLTPRPRACAAGA